MTPAFASLLLSALSGGRPRVPIVCAQLHNGAPGSAGLSNPSAITARQELTVTAPDTGAVGLTGVPPSWEVTAAETVAAVSLWSGFDGDPSAMCMFTLPAQPPVTVADGDTLVLGSCGLEWAPAAAGLWAPAKTVTAPTARAAAGMLAPRVTADGVVAVPPMNAAAAMLAPVVRTYRTPAPTMHANAGMLTPSVTAGAKVAVPLATAAAAALAPTVATRKAVAAPLMTATAAALAPTATTKSVVSVPTMAAAAQALMPRLAGSAVIPVMTAEASAKELAPTISASSVIVVPLSAAAAQMLVPTVKTTLPVTFDALGSGAASLASSGSWSHNAAGNYVLAFVVTEGATSAVSYGGVAMTLLAYAYYDNSASYGEFSVWGLASPPSGEETVVASMSGSHYFVANTVSYNDVSAVGSILTAYGAGAASQSLTCAAGQMIVHGFGVVYDSGTGAAGTFTAYSGGTERYNLGNGHTGLLIQDSSASTTFTGTTSSIWSAAGIVLQ
ncbi:hypothetical protein [Mycobacterium avium]|uniref:hypothetical protein n=1 Tax=Mycobacterium avium TaxID=1764 RepID=UPI00045B2ADB|nr:hypothetical protein [Mycobacterium avium]KBR63544.1 hypothetical protein X425_02373 [Mycobacterium avium XTB13-223]